MSTRCFLVGPDDDAAQERPGAVWEAPYLATASTLSPEYRRDHADRAPLFVRLPDGTAWPVDLVSSDGRTGWNITGEVPNLTAQPSIDTGTYHGWLQDGVLSDDLAGRTYDDPDGAP